MLGIALHNDSHIFYDLVLFASLLPRHPSNGHKRHGLIVCACVFYFMFGARQLAFENRHALLRRGGRVQAWRTLHERHGLDASPKPIIMNLLVAVGTAATGCSDCMTTSTEHST